MIISGAVRYHDDLGPLLKDINLVSPHPQNPNNGDQEAIEVSIEINGMYRPVEAQRSTGFVLAGNTTYASCLALGASILPIVWLDVNDEEALRILLVDNQAARLARMDQGLLRPHLDTLLETELRLLGTGYPDVPATVPFEPEYGHNLSIYLTGDLLASWMDVPGESDRDRLEFLLDLR